MVLGGVISCLLFSQQNIVYLGGVGAGSDDFDKKLSERGWGNQETKPSTRRRNHVIVYSRA